MDILQLYGVHTAIIFCRTIGPAKAGTVIATVLRVRQALRLGIEDAQSGSARRSRVKDAPMMSIGLWTKLTP